MDKHASSDNSQEFITSVENSIQIAENHLAAISGKNLARELLSLTVVKAQIKVFEEKRNRIKSLRETLLTNRSELRVKHKEGLNVPSP